MEFRILGPLEVVDDGHLVELGRPKQRAVLAILLLHADRVVAVDRLVEQVWDGHPPPQAMASLQAYVYHLRRVLEPRRAARTPPRVLRSQPPGYRLAVAAEDLDAARFQALAAEGRRLLEVGSFEQAADVLAAGLALWRGAVLADLGDEPFVQVERNRLAELRLAALEDRIAADLELGRHAAVTAELDELVTVHPFRERLHGLRMIGLYRAGRQADALAAYQHVRGLLREELGVDPSPGLQQLEAGILHQAPVLGLPPAAGIAGGPGQGGTPGDDAWPEPSGTFVGRSEELAVIARLLAAASTGRGRLLLVSGEPGIGKSRLAEEAGRLAVAGGARVSWGRCWEGEGAPALWPWLQVAGDLLAGPSGDRLNATAAAPAAVLSRLLPELAGTSPPPPAAVATLDAVRFRLYQAVADVLERAAAERPLLVVLDDLHWADLPSLRLLAFLAGRVGAARLMVLATYRSGEAANPALADGLAALARQPVDRMVLAGLAEPEVAALMAGTTGADPNHRLVRLVHARTDGNPFFVVELLRLLASETRRAGDPDVAESAAASRIPVGVRDVLRRRLALLPDQTNAVLVVAAVVGRDFDLDTVGAVTGLVDDDALDAVEAALLSGLVVEDPDVVGRYRFVHALVREAIYEDVSRARRARLHARVGDALAARHRGDPAHVLEIAHHRWLAAPVTGGRAALPALIAAAHQAVQGLGHEEAERQLRRALDLLATTQPSAEGAATELSLLLRLGAVHSQLRGPAAAQTAAAFGRALALAEEVADDAAEFAALNGLHEAITSRGEHRRARELAERALTVAERLDRRDFRAAGHMMLGRTLYIQGEFEQARHHLERSLELVGAAGAGPWPVPLPVTARILLGAVLELLGLQGEAAEAVEAGIAQSRFHPPFVQGTALSMGSHVAVLRRDVGLAKERATASLALATRWHFGSIESYARTVLGWVQAQEGDPAGALASLRGGVADIEARGAQLMVPTMLGLAAEAELLADRPTQALQLLDDALRRVHRTGERFTEAELHRLRARALLAQSPPRPDEAAAAYGTAVEVARRQGATAAERRAGEELLRLCPGTTAHSSNRAGAAERSGS